MSWVDGTMDARRLVETLRRYDARGADVPPGRRLLLVDRPPVAGDTVLVVEGRVASTEPWTPATAGPGRWIVAAVRPPATAPA
jgi:hypothetical protein